MDIFDDTTWCTSSLIKYVIDHHTPVKSKTVSSQSVPFMNSVLRKTQYRRNMKRNKFKKNRKSCWEENKRLKNVVIKIRKYSMRKYFEGRCSKQDKKIMGNYFAIVSWNSTMEIT